MSAALSFPLTLALGGGGGVGGGGNVATDAIFDAAGDLVVGSGANTAVRLAKGSDGAVLTMVSGAVAWDGPNVYTMETRPAANAANLHRVILVTTGSAGAFPIYREFICITQDGGANYYWVPIGGFLDFLWRANGTTHGPQAAGTESGNLTTDTIPANLVVPGCQIQRLTQWAYTGTVAAKNWRMKVLAGGAATTFRGPATSNSTATHAYVEGHLNVVAMSGAGSAVTPTVISNNSAQALTDDPTGAVTSLNVDWTAAVNFYDTIDLDDTTTVDTATPGYRRLRILYPSLVS